MNYWQRPKSLDVTLRDQTSQVVELENLRSKSGSLEDWMTINAEVQAALKKMLQSQETKSHLVSQGRKRLLGASLLAGSIFCASRMNFPKVLGAKKNSDKIASCEVRPVICQNNIRRSAVAKATIMRNLKALPLRIRPKANVIHESVPSPSKMIAFHTQPKFFVSRTRVALKHKKALTTLPALRSCAAIAESRVTATPAHIHSDDHILTLQPMLSSENTVAGRTSETPLANVAPSEPAMAGGLSEQQGKTEQQSASVSVEIHQSDGTSAASTNNVETRVKVSENSTDQNRGNNVRSTTSSVEVSLSTGSRIASIR